MGDAGGASGDIATMRCSECSVRYSDPTRNTDPDESTWEMTGAQWHELLATGVCPTCKATHEDEALIEKYNETLAFIQHNDEKAQKDLDDLRATAIEKIKDGHTGVFGMLYATANFETQTYYAALWHRVTVGLGTIERHNIPLGPDAALGYVINEAEARLLRLIRPFSRSTSSTSNMSEDAETEAIKDFLGRACDREFSPHELSDLRVAGLKFRDALYALPRK